MDKPFEPIYTHDYAARIVGVFEDLLAEHDIHIPCESEDEEEEQGHNEKSGMLYGSTYGNLLDEIEDILCNMLDSYSEKDGYVYGSFSGKY